MVKTKKKSGKNLRKSGKSRGKIREFHGIKKLGTLHLATGEFLQPHNSCHYREFDCHTFVTKNSQFDIAGGHV